MWSSNCDFNSDYSSVAFHLRGRSYVPTFIHADVQTGPGRRRPSVKQHFCISNSRCVRLTAHSVSYSYAASTHTRARRTQGPSADVKYGTIVRSARLRELQVHGHLLLLLLLPLPPPLPPLLPSKFATRDSQDRRNIAGRKPTEKGS